MYLTSTNENAIVSANEKISSNCGLPNEYGTVSWDIVKKSVSSNLWFILMPPPDLWGNEVFFTQEQMMNGVDMTDIIQLPRNPNWFPPPPPIN